MSVTERTQEELQVQAIKDLRDHIALNDFGLPTGIYRLDHLPFHDYVEDWKEQEDQLRLEAQEKQNEARAAEQKVLQQKKDSALKAKEDAEDGILVDEDEEPTEEDEEIIAGAIDALTGDPGAFVDRSVRSGDHTDLNGSPLAETVAATKLPGRTAGFPTSELQRSFVPLFYDEGYPTFDDGDPLWLQLRYEPPSAYRAFERYLQMNATVPADVPTVDTTPGAQGATGFRSIAQLAAHLQNDRGGDGDIMALQKQLKVWSALYYWDWRAKAYDLFRVARHRQQEQIRAIETQDSHYLLGRKIVTKMMDFIESEDFEDQLTPKVAFDGLKLATTLERLSAGLPAGAPQSKENVRVQSFEMTMRNIAQNNPETREHKIDDKSSLIMGALSDPQTLETVQELILRVHSVETERT